MWMKIQDFEDLENCGNLEDCKDSDCIEENHSKNLAESKISI